MDEKTIKEFIEKLAKESGELIMKYFANPDLDVEFKEDKSPVTIADRGSEEVMRKLINKEFPDHGILGEEFGNENLDAEYVWALDPIDGTKSFTAGTPQFGTLICLQHKGQPIFGAIHNPVSKQLLMGDNKICTLNGHPVKVKEPKDLSDAILLTTDLDNPSQYQDAEGWKDLVNKSKKLYTWGDCHAYHLLSTGSAHIAVDPIMNPYDLLALIPIVRGAGGVITDWQGNAPETGESIVAATPKLHAEIIKILNPSK